MWEWILNGINIILQILGLRKDGGEKVKNIAKNDSNNINIKDSEVNIINDNGSSETSSSVEHTHYSKKYTSLFVENEKIYSEKIEIDIDDAGNVIGNVYLDDECTYSLNGIFKNRILTGEYSSVGSEVDERGTISLKLITEDILSGFCTFSKVSVASDQIRMSPYVWVKGVNKDLANGTFEFCTECHNESKTCCCASECVDMPILLKNESSKLRKIPEIIKLFKTNW